MDLADDALVLMAPIRAGSEFFDVALSNAILTCFERIEDEHAQTIPREVDTASDGLDCLAKLRQMAPALLVLDQESLGGSDGVLAWLREESRSFKIPVILMATTAAGWDLGVFKEAPIVDYLPKPVALTALLDSVRSAVARKERRQPVEPVPHTQHFHRMTRSIIDEPVRHPSHARAFH